MTEKIYFIENTNALENAMAKIEHDYPCFTERELVEMNYSKITIKARTEDIRHIEDILAPLV